jgi:hypothetical protein
MDIPRILVYHGYTVTSNDIPCISMDISGIYFKLVNIRGISHGYTMYIHSVRYPSSSDSSVVPAAVIAESPSVIVVHEARTPQPKAQFSLEKAPSNAVLCSWMKPAKPGVPLTRPATCPNK